MADQTPDAGQQESGKRGKGMLLGGILVAVMLLEGGGIFFAMRFFGADAAPASGAGLVDVEPQEPSHQELLVANFRAPNMKTGKLYLYDIEIQVLVAEKNVERVRELLENRKATFEDRLARIVRSADPQQLQEPGLEILRRQVKHEIDQIAGQEDIVSEVLIPKCTPLPAFN